MKTLVAAATALVLMGAAPALAMSCCGGGTKGKAAMCAKGDMKGGAMGRTAMKGKGCCCEGMSSGRMSSRRS